MNLNELERDTLQILLHNEILLSIMYKVLNSVSELHTPQINELESNELLGEKYRAFEISKKIIKDAFDLLLSLKIEKIEKKVLSRAK